MTVFSRSGASSPLGKCTEELKSLVPEAVKADFAITARMLNKPNISEHLRDVVTQHLYGVVSSDLQAIVWEHACKETDSEFLRDLLHKAIFGCVHDLTIQTSESGLHGGNTANSSSSRRASDAH
jgi:hypothetical protein